MLFSKVCQAVRKSFAPRPFNSISRLKPARLFAVLASSFLVTLLTGCAVLPPWTSEPPEPPIDGVTAYWFDHVHVITNTVNGATIAGIAGRIWLEGVEPKHKEDAHGKIVVELYDMSAGPRVPAKLLVTVSYTRADLPKFKKKDMIGDGYTLFVPWEGYHPDIKEVKLQAYYVPDKGPTLRSQEQAITLRPAEQPQMDFRQQATPVTVWSGKQ